MVILFRNPSYYCEITLACAGLSLSWINFHSLVRPLISDVRFPVHTMLPWWISSTTTILWTYFWMIELQM
jgi:hypothetical protein